MKEVAEAEAEATEATEVVADVVVDQEVVTEATEVAEEATEIEMEVTTV